MTDVVSSPKAEPRSGGLIGAALGATLLFSGVLVAPRLSLFAPFGFLAATVSPVPLIVLRLRRGLLSAILAAALAATMIGGIFSVRPALGFLLFLALPALLIGEAMARGRGLLRGCAWAFALLVVEISVALFFAGPRLADAVLLTHLDQQRSPETLQQMRSSGLPPERVETWAEQMALLHNAMQVVYPAFFVILGALVVLANGSALRAYLARRDPGWLEGGEFERIRWPLGMAVLFVASGASLLVPAVRPLSYNVLLLVAFFFALQGLAVVAYYAHRLPGPAFLMAAAVLFILTNPWAVQVLALLGLFDIWFDFRRWADPPEAEKG